MMNPDIHNKSFFKIPFSVQDYHGMPYRRLGGSGLHVSTIGLGTWKIGYPESGDESRIAEGAAFDLFDKAVELGVTFWDTANRYNNASGNSERVIGSWFKKNPAERRNVVVATKLGGAMDGITPNHCGLSRMNIMESVYSSLERLHTDHIDLLYFHAFDNETPMEESLAAIEDLARHDAVRYFAVSNFTVAQLQAYKIIEQSTSLRCKVVAVQNQFDILQGEYGDYKGVLDHSARENISFVAWSPMARGLLTGRYLDPSKVGPGHRLYDENLLSKTEDAGVMIKLQQLADLAKSWGMALSQLTIAYMLTLPGMGPVIAGASTVEQLTLNAGAGVIHLEEGQLAQVRAVLYRG